MSCLILFLLFINVVVFLIFFLMLRVKDDYPLEVLNPESFGINSKRTVSFLFHRASGTNVAAIDNKIEQAMVSTLFTMHRTLLQSNGPNAYLNNPAIFGRHFMQKYQRTVFSHHKHLNTICRTGLDTFFFCIF